MIGYWSRNGVTGAAVRVCGNAATDRRGNAPCERQVSRPRWPLDVPCGVRCEPRRWLHRPAGLIAGSPPVIDYELVPVAVNPVSCACSMRSPKGFKGLEGGGTQAYPPAVVQPPQTATTSENEQHHASGHQRQDDPGLNPNVVPPAQINQQVPHARFIIRHRKQSSIIKH